MPDFVRVKLDDGAEVTISAAFAESHSLKVLNKPSTRFGRPLPAKPPVDLRGAELDAALEAAGLPKGGTAAEKRERLAEHQMSATAGGATPTIVGESDTSKEDSK